MLGLSEVVVVHLFELFHFPFLLAKGTHHPYAGKILLQHGTHFAFCLVSKAEALMHLAEEPHGKSEKQGHQNHGIHGEGYIFAQHNGQGNDHHEHRVHHLHHLYRQEPADGIHIASAALNQVARFRLHMIGKGQTLQVLIQTGAQLIGNVFAGHSGQPTFQIGEQTVDQVQHHQCYRHDPQIAYQKIPSTEGFNGC